MLLVLWIKRQMSQNGPKCGDIARLLSISYCKHSLPLLTSSFYSFDSAVNMDLKNLTNEYKNESQQLKIRIHQFRLTAHITIRRTSNIYRFMTD